MGIIESTGTDSHHGNAGAAKTSVFCVTLLWGPSDLVGKRFIIEDTLCLGRASTVLPAAVTADTLLSRRHAEVTVNGSELLLRDLESHNGTWLNGARLASGAATRVNVGDVVLVGSHLFLLQSTPALFRTRESAAFIGSSLPLAKLLDSLDAAAKTKAPLLVVGPSGSGKTLAAFESHRLRERSGPLVTLHAASLTDVDVHRVLFGEETDLRRTAGLLEEANGGTLVIDRIEEASPLLQSALASFLDSGLVRPVGSGKARAVDVCLVATSAMSKHGLLEPTGLTPELANRFSAWCIELTPLMDRKEDIPALARTFIDSLGGEIRLSPAFVLGLVRAPWPGNVRELFSFLERCALETSSGELTEEMPDAFPTSSRMLLPSDAGVEIAKDGSFFKIGDAKTSLVGRRTLRALLGALVEATTSHREESLGIDRLFAVGWPGERVRPRAGASRVYVAISSLRKMGLSEVIERTAAGYRLVLTQQVVLVDVIA